MGIKKIYLTPTFQKSWKKLAKKVKQKAIKKEKIFRHHVIHPSLLTHKLKGELKDYWSFSIDYHTRIVFRFLKRGEVLFVDIGSDEIYR